MHALFVGDCGDAAVDPTHEGAVFRRARDFARAADELATVCKQARNSAAWDRAFSTQPAKVILRALVDTVNGREQDKEKFAEALQYVYRDGIDKGPLNAALEYLPYAFAHARKEKKRIPFDNEVHEHLKVWLQANGYEVPTESWVAKTLKGWGAPRQGRGKKKG